MSSVTSNSMNNSKLGVEVVSCQYVTRSSKQTSGNQCRNDVIFISQIRKQILGLFLIWLETQIRPSNPKSYVFPRRLTSFLLSSFTILFYLIIMCAIKNHKYCGSLKLSMFLGIEGSGLIQLFKIIPHSVASHKWVLLVHLVKLALICHYYVHHFMHNMYITAILWSAIISTILQMRTLRPEQFNYAVLKWQSWDSNPGSLVQSPWC